MIIQHNCVRMLLSYCYLKNVRSQNQLKFSREHRGLFADLGAKGGRFSPNVGS